MLLLIRCVMLVMLMYSLGFEKWILRILDYFQNDAQ